VPHRVKALKSSGAMLKLLGETPVQFRLATVLQSVSFHEAFFCCGAVIRGSLELIGHWWYLAIGSIPYQHRPVTPAPNKRRDRAGLK
jgi:hypothetical protein